MDAAGPGLQVIANYAAGYDNLDLEEAHRRVFENEPEVLPGLLALENVVLTPHLGSATLEARTAMGLTCVNALRAVLLKGRRPDTLVSLIGLESARLFSGVAAGRRPARPGPRRGP